MRRCTTPGPRTRNQVWYILPRPMSRPDPLTRLVEALSVPSPGECSSTGMPMLPMFDHEPEQESSNSPVSSFSPVSPPRLIACDGRLLFSSQHEHCSPPSLRDPAARDKDGGSRSSAMYALWGADCVAEANAPCPSDPMFLRQRGAARRLAKVSDSAPVARPAQ